MWVESAGPGTGSTFHFTIRGQRRRAAAERAARLHRRAARAAGQAHCWSSTTTPPTAASSRCRPAQVGHGGRATPNRRARRCAGSRRASASTSPSSTCTCRRWTALDAGAAHPRQRVTRCRSCCSARSAGARLATPRAVRRHLAKPLRQSQLFDTLVTLLAHEAAPRPRARRAEAAASMPTWRRAIRCASFWPRTTS